MTLPVFLALAFLLDTGISWWTVMAVFIGPSISAGVTILVMHLNRRYTETKEQKITREKLEAEAVQAELNWKRQQEKTLETLRQEMSKACERFMQTIKLQRTMLSAAESNRMQVQLKSEQDFAAITGILKDSTDAQKQMTGLLANVGSLQHATTRHDQEFQRVNQLLDTMNQNLLELVRTHPAAPAPAPPFIAPLPASFSDVN